MKDFLVNLQTDKISNVEDYEKLKVERKKKKKEKPDVKRIEVTNALLKSWIQGIREKQDLASVQKLLFCLYIISRGLKKKFFKDKEKKVLPYQISSIGLQLKIVLLALKYTHVVLQKSQQEENGFNERARFTLHSLQKSIVLLLRDGSRRFEESFEHILTYLFPLLPLLVQVEKENEDMENANVLLFKSFIPHVAHVDQNIRNKAFLLIYRMFRYIPDLTFRDEVLRAMYFYFLSSTAARRTHRKRNKKSSSMSIEQMDFCKTT